MTWREGVRRAASSGAGIAVAMMTMHVATYGFTMLAARFLGPQAYGALGAAMNVLLVISVASLGLQATAARRISTTPGEVASIERSVLRVTLRVALGLGVALLVLSPLVDRLLRLDSPMMAVVLALTAVPVTLMGGQAGVLQGERRWGPLGAVYVAAGVPRLVVGTALVWWQPEALWALLGVAVGACAPVLVGAVAVARRAPGSTTPTRSTGPQSAPPSGPQGAESGAQQSGLAVLREAVHNSQALFAYFALSNVDIVVARNVLSDHESGLYAAGLIMTKAMLFLPQFVVVVAFPSMADPADRRRALGRSLALVLLLGLAGTAAAWWFSGLAMVFVGGSDFAALEPRLWLFAVLGTVLSLVQLLVYAVLARQGRRSVWFVWLALVVLVALGLGQSSLLGLVSVVVLVDTALLAVLLAISAWLTTRPTGARAGEVAAAGGPGGS